MKVNLFYWGYLITKIRWKHRYRKCQKQILVNIYQLCIVCLEMKLICNCFQDSIFCVAAAFGCFYYWLLELDYGPPRLIDRDTGRHSERSWQFLWGWDQRSAKLLLCHLIIKSLQPIIHCLLIVYSLKINIKKKSI